MAESGAEWRRRRRRRKKEGGGAAPGQGEQDVRSVCAHVEWGQGGGEEGGMGEEGGEGLMGVLGRIVMK